jgi:hypothetical protein
LESPCLIALPFEFVAWEVFPQSLLRTGVEQVPGTDEVKGGVRWTETANIKDPSESTVIDEDIRRGG